MPVKTYTTVPALINDPDATGISKTADPKGATYDKVDITRNASAVVISITFKAPQAQLDILEANGYAV